MTKKEDNSLQQCPFSGGKNKSPFYDYYGTSNETNKKFAKVTHSERTEEILLISTYLYIREVHLEHIRAWVAGVEKHELGLLQMIRRETLLDLNIAAIKDINDCWEGNLSWIKQIRLVISQIQYVHVNIWCQDCHHHLDDFLPKTNAR